MKLSKLVIPVALILGSTNVYADSWWEKAKNILSEPETAEVAQKAVLQNADIEAAFREALTIGADNVVSQLGTADGFNTNELIHIPLPKEMQAMKGIMDKVGMGSMMDDLELKLNRAAEAATPKAKALFLDAINKMSFEDIRKIYEGPEDSATQYFKGVMSDSLGSEMKPIVDSTLASVGAIQAMDSVMGQYDDLPFVPDVKADLTQHVVNQGMEGIFHYMAVEEAEIRKNPLKQTTKLLEKVFGG